MRIMIDARMLLERPTGIGRYISNLLAQLSAIDTLNSYFVLTNNKKAINLSEHKANITVREIGPMPLSVAEHFVVPQMLRRENIDVFHTPSFIAPLKIPCRYVMTIHDLIHVLFPKEFPLKTQIYYKIVVKRAIRNASHIITDSYNSKRDIGKWANIEDRRIRTISLAIEEKYTANPSEDLVRKVKVKLGIGKRFILYNGNKKPHKNMPTLLEAMRRISRGRGDIGFLLVIIGKRDESHAETDFTNLNKTIGKLGLENDILFTGQISDEELFALYNAAEALVLPSLYEGFGLPALEAMACGCPAIVSRSSSLPEVCGDAAYYINPNDADSIAGGIVRLLKDDVLRSSLREKGKERAKQFSWRKCAAETLRVYEEVFNETGHSA